MNWSTRRKILYGSSFLLIAIAVILFVFRTTLFPTPTCSDGAKNGFELDVDCGGDCVLKCTSEVIPLSVVWTRALQTKPNTYDLVALIANKNIDNAPREVTYTFTAYDAEGNFLLTKTGKTAIPVEGEIPVVIQNVPSYSIPTKLVLTLSPASHFATREKSTMPSVKVVSSVYEPGEISRVYTTIENTTLRMISALPVRVVLYDQNQNAIAAGETVIQRLNAEETKNLVYTWPQPLPETVARIRVYPVFSAFEN